MTLKIFISHSAVDAPIAEALIEVFKKSLNLSSISIRCTSVDGYRLPGGADTGDILRREVEESEILIGLITNESLQSTYVLFELGARWGNRKPLMPILAAGATASILKSPLNNYNALNCNNESHIYQMVDDISKILDLPLERADIYRESVQNLISQSKKKKKKVKILI